jgi:hypothetical protein
MKLSYMSIVTMKGSYDAINLFQPCCTRAPNMFGRSVSEAAARPGPPRTAGSPPGRLPSMSYWLRESAPMFGYCPGWKMSFLVVKRPARPYKSAIQNRFTMVNAKGA